MTSDELFDELARRLRAERVPDGLVVRQLSDELLDPPIHLRIEPAQLSPLLIDDSGATDVFPLAEPAVAALQLFLVDFEEAVVTNRRCSTFHVEGVQVVPERTDV